jgi:hypothetical protein
VTGTVDFGCGPAVSASGTNAMFVVKLSPSGACLWSKVAGSASGAETTSLAADAAGDVYVGGVFSGSIDLGCGTQIAATANTLVVAKLDASGSCLWSDQPGGGPSAGPHLAVAASGAVYVTGGFAGALNFGNGPILSAGGTDVFVAALASGNGASLWSTRFGDSANQTARALARDASDNVIIAGSFSGTVNFGSGVLTNPGPGDEGFAAKFTSSGVPVWSRPFADATNQIAQGVAADPSTGQVVVAGQFSNAAALDGWIAKLDPAGNNIWSSTVTSSGSADILGVAVDAAGEIAYTTTFGPDAGGFVSMGADDALITKTDSSGNPLWFRQISGTDEQSMTAIAFDPSGDPLVAGFTVGSNSLVSGPFGGGADIMAVKLAP